MCLANMTFQQVRPTALLSLNWVIATWTKNWAASNTTRLLIPWQCQHRRSPSSPGSVLPVNPPKWPYIQLPTGPGGSQGCTKHWGGVRNRAFFPVEPCREVVLRKSQDSVTRGTYPPRPSSCNSHLGSPGNKLRLFSVCRHPGLLSTGLCVPLQWPRTARYDLGLPGCCEQALWWEEGTKSNRQCPEEYHFQNQEPHGALLRYPVNWEAATADSVPNESCQWFSAFKTKAAA